MQSYVQYRQPRSAFNSSTQSKSNIAHRIYVAAVRPTLNSNTNHHFAKHDDGRK